MFIVFINRDHVTGEAKWLHDEVGKYGTDWTIEWLQTDTGLTYGKNMLFKRESDAVAYVLRWL